MNWDSNTSLVFIERHPSLIIVTKLILRELGQAFANELTFLWN